MGRHVSAGDVSVSEDGDADVSGVDTVVSGAVSGCLCDLDRVSRGDIVMSIDEISLPGGGCAMVSGVDESVCGVNSVLAAGVLDLCHVDTVLTGVDESMCCVNSVMSPGVLGQCGVDTVVSGVDERVCGVSSVMTASELDVCACDSIVSDEAGNSSSVEMIVSIYDAFLVGGWLSVVGDTSMCGAGVARSDRGDNGVVICARSGST